jgi:hypothetical protein
MLPVNATPLNERLIQALIEEHQAEIRRCFVPRPDGGRTAPGVRLLHLISPLRRGSEPPTSQETVPTMF